MKENKINKVLSKLEEIMEKIAGKLSGGKQMKRTKQYGLRNELGKAKSENAKLNKQLKKQNNDDMEERLEKAENLCKYYEDKLNEVIDKYERLQEEYNKKESEYLEAEKLLKSAAAKFTNLKEELRKSQEECDNLKNSQNDDSDNEMKFIKSIITIVDQIEGLRLYSEKSGNEKLIETVKKNIKYINKELSRLGIESRSFLGENFDANFCECIETVNDPRQEDETIVDELKLCYIYKNRVIRPAEVVIVDNYN